MDRTIERTCRLFPEAVLDEAREAYEEAMAAIEAEREKLDQRAEKETERWKTQHQKLANAVDRSRNKAGSGGIHEALGV